VNLRKLVADTSIKGLTWDPVGEYLATQIEDRSMKVWRTSDWKEEACIKTPFQSKQSSFFARCTWSPEGSLIIAPNAVLDDDQRPCAVLIRRHEWGDQLERDSLLGHTGTVQVAVSHPTMFFSRISN
jgi:protein HIRA/HIR1